MSTPGRLSRTCCPGRYEGSASSSCGARSIATTSSASRQIPATEKTRRPVQRPRFAAWSRRMSQIVARRGTEPLTGSRDASLRASFMFEVAKPDGGVVFRPSGGQSSHQPNSARTTRSSRNSFRRTRRRTSAVGVRTIAQSPSSRPALCGEGPADLHGRIRRFLAQRRHVPMRTVDEPAALRRGQHQRKILARGHRTVGRLDMVRQRRIAMTEHQLGIDLHAPRWRRESRDRSIAASLGIFFVTERLRKAHALRMVAQLLDGYAERSQLMIPAGADVAAEEFRRHPQSQRQFRDDLVVRLALAEPSQHLRPELDRFDGLLRDLEADLQCISFPGHAGREHDVGILGRRVHEHVDMHVEVERAQRLAIARGMPCDTTKFVPKLISARTR